MNSTLYTQYFVHLRVCAMGLLSNRLIIFMAFTLFCTFMTVFLLFSGDIVTNIGQGCQNFNVGFVVIVKEHTLAFFFSSSPSINL